MKPNVYIAGSTELCAKVIIIRADYLILFPECLYAGIGRDIIITVTSVTSQNDIGFFWQSFDKCNVTISCTIG